MTKNKYYYVEFDMDGETIRRNLDIDATSVEYTMSKLEGKTEIEIAKQILENTWNLPIISIKKATKKAMKLGQF
jgi:hypothetical protein